ncbi:MazG nucleotide pyrophosphohydrolase domain-containing protein [Tissierella sp.]|uniref:MazG nucleotide pyrophosphohydrolase domain-containing protein n=1 Tax=Tissierella sp. TaxID=41274 RepID=UPI00285EDFB7|nr:MazG nucleotide pyrophosphohydrolase domain-containing protein [Tissierella sp.]MDR7855254.1 MazG nucleotide pyrophosphohydrolase domain-containing protein [Tissierella sp.]
MDSFGLNEMQKMQKELQEKYKDKWGALSPEKGRNQLLWMMIEAGEVADIIKKKGDNQIVDNEETRKDFVEELCDVLMYFNDVMLCYSISPEELKKVYLEKHCKNMGRW